MSEPASPHRNTQSSLRLWPGVTIVVLQWLLRFVLPAIIPGAMVVGVMSAFVGGVLLMVWWLFFSRAYWSERLGAVVLMFAGLVVTRMLLDESMATAGMGMTFYVYAMPVLSLAFVLWAVTCRRRVDGPQWASMAAAILLSCGVWILVRTGGFTSNFDQDFAWRWSKTPEERLLAEETADPSPSPIVEGTLETAAHWPGFRGPKRDSKIYGVQVVTDWTAFPPQELWRRPVGPGWSSFAIIGDHVLTQEQRGEDEVVACYHLKTGQPIWKHSDTARFWEANAGAGPRATPTIHEGRVYALGATGVLNALNVADGSLFWSRSAVTDTGANIPEWGISGSPVVTGENVIVATAGTLAAYDCESGALRWKGPDGWDGYSSPHLMTIEDVEQVLLMSKAGAIGMSVDEGIILWHHDWPGGSRIVQPAQIENGELLMSRGETSGLSRVGVSRVNDTWSVEERWTTNRFKPYFSDFVFHEGNIYGFDGNRLVSATVDTARRNWKGGRYGSGQLLLLADQDLLLIISEQGELALVEARPEQFTELATFTAIEGKTWNHPVLVSDVLLIRNDREMAAFRLSLK